MPAEYKHMPDQKKTAEEWIRSVVKAGANIIPIAGGPLAELIDSAWVPKHVKKMQEWYHYVDETLKHLLTEGKITMEQLYEDERFASLFQRTTKVYLDNVDNEKRPAIQSALKSSLSEAIPLDKKYVFIQILETLTEIQLLILKAIYENSRSKDYLYRTKLDQKLAEKYTGGDQAYLELLKTGLSNNHLLNYSGSDVVEDGAKQWHMDPSQIGGEFYNYITTP